MEMTKAQEPWYDYWHKLGESGGIDSVAKKLREESGKLYASGQDFKANAFRELADLLDKQAEDVHRQAAVLKKIAEGS